MGDNSNKIYSEPVQEIFEAIPSRLIRWGSIVILAELLLMLVGCYFIRYPETLNSSITITSTNPPSRIAARYTGLIDSVAIVNGQRVHKDDILVLFSSQAEYDDIVKVEQLLNQFGANEEVKTVLDSPLLESHLTLGDLQLAWTKVVSVAKEYRVFRELNQGGRHTEIIQRRIVEREKSREALILESQIMAENMQIQQNILERDSLLFMKGAISENEFELTKQSYLSRKANQAVLETTLHSMEENLLQLSQNLYELRLQQVTEEYQYNLRMVEALRQMEEEVIVWMETYAVVSPIDGTVSLQDYWSKGQHANAGDIIASVVPSVQNSLEGRMKVLSKGFGKVRVGQEVKIHANGFPYMEYGVLKGRVSKISLAPERSSEGIVSYLVEIDFPNGLVSTYGLELPLIHEMDGTAWIIIENKRLIDHFLEPIKSIILN